MINIIKKRLSKGLAALVMSAGINCGDEVHNNNFYGPDGEEILVQSGACDEFKDKYLWFAGNGLAGTKKKIGEECRVEFENQDNNGLYFKGIIAGNEITIYEKGRSIGGPLPWTFQLLKGGEFSREDLVHGDGGQYDNLFLCYFTKEESLMAIGENGAVVPSLDNLIKAEDQPFPGEEIVSNERINSAWFNECKRENGF